MDDTANTPPADACAQCGKELAPDDRIGAGDRFFCRSCYETLFQELQRSVQGLTTDVNYPMAALGAVLGGAAGVVLWWGITVATKVSFGLAAVAIGWLVAQGAVRLAGGKRSTGLQVLAVLVSIASFVVASYLVNMSFINEELARRGLEQRVPFPPASFEGLLHVVSLGFGLMDTVFLGILVWQAWSIPRPPRLPDRMPA
jgi:hypothetical protein